MSRVVSMVRKYNSLYEKNKKIGIEADVFFLLQRLNDSEVIEELKRNNISKDLIVKDFFYGVAKDARASFKVRQELEYFHKTIENLLINSSSSKFSGTNKKDLELAREMAYIAIWASETRMNNSAYRFFAHTSIYMVLALSVVVFAPALIVLAGKFFPLALNSLIPTLKVSSAVSAALPVLATIGKGVTFLLAICTALYAKYDVSVLREVEETNLDENAIKMVARVLDPNNSILKRNILEPGVAPIVNTSIKVKKDEHDDVSIEHKSRKSRRV